MTDEIDTYVARSRPCSLPAKEAAANDPSILGIRHDPVRDRLVVQRTHGSPYGPSIAGLTTHYTSSPEADPSWCSLVLTQGIKTADFLQTLRGLTG
jgi:hypothetical protein